MRHNSSGRWTHLASTRSWLPSRRRGLWGRAVASACSSRGSGWSTISCRSTCNTERASLQSTAVSIETKGLMDLHWLSVSQTKRDTSNRMALSHARFTHCRLLQQGKSSRSRFNAGENETLHLLFFAAPEISAGSALLKPRVTHARNLSPVLWQSKKDAASGSEGARTCVCTPTR